MKILIIIFLLLSVNMRAADITITIPDAEVTRVLNAVAVMQGYTGLTPLGGAETKAQFTKRWIRDLVKAQLKAVEGNAAAVSARATTDAAVDAIGIN
jgi:hypothetical protein